MGAVLGPIGSALGSCVGSCAAAGCCALAFSGSTNSPKASRCLLVWLQAFTAMFALLLTWNTDWLGKACRYDVLGNSLKDTLNICACETELIPNDCYASQIIYRAEAAATLVFVFLIFLVMSGCGAGAAHSLPVMKFFAIIGFTLVFSFFPNNVFTGFGIFSSAASALFLVAQSVVFIDFAYTWNDTWFKNGQDARRVGNGTNLWMIGIIVASVSFFLCSVIGVGIIFSSWPAVRWLVIVTFLMALTCLILSITEWCEHGNLLTSCFVMAYAMWLCYTTASPTEFKWVGITICSISLTAFAFMPSLGSTKATEDAVPLSEGDDAGIMSRHAEVTPSDFFGQCGVHAVASMYIASMLAPTKTSATFIARAASTLVSLLLYGWTLVAPKLLSGRSF